MSFRREIESDGSSSYLREKAQSAVTGIQQSVKVEAKGSVREFYPAEIVLGSLAVGGALVSGIAGGFEIWPEAVVGGLGAAFVLHGVSRKVRFFSPPGV